MPVSNRDVLAGGGEIHALARNVDWAATSMGAVELWPDHVRSAVELCLSLPLPAALSCGHDLVQIYNEGYARQLGRKHPHALGRSSKDCWADVWDVLGPRYERVLAAGEPILDEDLLLLADRHGFVEESYFTISIGPVRDASGSVAGALLFSVETSAQVRETRRLEALRRVAARLGGAGSAREACASAGRALASTEDVPYALLYLLDPPAGDARLAGWAGLTPGSRLAPERVRLASPPEPEDPWRLGEQPRGVRVVRVSELHPAEDELGVGPWRLPHREAIVLPVVPVGQERPLAYLVAGVNPACPLDDAYRRFLSGLTETVAAALTSAQRHEELRWRAEALADAVQARSRFMAGVSHELRTPLNAIIGHVDLLREGIVGPLTDRQGQHVSRVRAAAVHLKGLIEEILAFSRVEVGAEDLHLVETDVRQLAFELAELLDPLIDQSNLRFDVRIPEHLRPIRTDPVKLRQILMNLLSNAQKYTDAGHIELLVEQERDGTVRAAVTDTGPGIERDDQKRIFEPFWRLPGTGERGGTGLGLTLARALARMLGGDLDVRSQPGAGSTFTVRVPDLRDDGETDQPGSGHYLRA